VRHDLLLDQLADSRDLQARAHSHSRATVRLLALRQGLFPIGQSSSVSFQASKSCPMSAGCYTAGITYSCHVPDVYSPVSGSWG
jgi:hypothetical protein